MTIAVSPLAHLQAVARANPIWLAKQVDEKFFVEVPHDPFGARVGLTLNK